MTETSPSRALFERFSATGDVPTLGNYGAFAVNVADRKLWAFDSSGSPVLVSQSLTLYDPARSYAPNDFVYMGQTVWRANAAIAPGAFDPAQWTRMTGDDTRSPETLSNSGLISGGALSAAVGSTQITVAAGSGAIVNTASVANPVTAIVEWGGTTVATPATPGAHIVSVNAGGAITFGAPSDTGLLSRTNIVLGTVFIGATGTVFHVTNVPVVSRIAAADAIDQSATVSGPFILRGLRMSGATGLTLTLTPGELFSRHARWRNTPTNPSVISVASGTVTFDVVRKDGAPVAGAGTQIQTTEYENGPVPAGTFTIQYLFADLGGTRRWMQVGQQSYATLPTAVAALAEDWQTYERFAPASQSCLLGAVIARSGAAAFGPDAATVAVLPGPQTPVTFAPVSGSLGSEFLRADGTIPLTGDLDFAGNSLLNVAIDDGIF